MPFTGSDPIVQRMIREAYKVGVDDYNVEILPGGFSNFATQLKITYIGLLNDLEANTDLVLDNMTLPTLPPIPEDPEAIENQ